jgi:hypothetical protein
MKKLSLLILLILVFTLVACGNTNQSDNPKTSGNDSGTSDDDDSGGNLVISADAKQMEDLSPDEFIALNKYLSNFVETYMLNYASIDSTDYDQTIATVFAIQHIVLNDNSAITFVDSSPDPYHGEINTYSLDSAQVDEVLAKYIGPHQKAGLPVRMDNWDSGIDYWYENGKYYFTQGKGIIDIWAQVVNLYANDDDTYTVVFDRYERWKDGELIDFPPNRYEPKENWGDHSNLVPAGPSHTAVIKRGTWNSREVWNLVSYSW